MTSKNEPKELVILQGGVGVVSPDSETQNKLFHSIADMKLEDGEEGLYAETARAIADVKDSVLGKPMVQSANPLRDEIITIFDNIKI